MVYMGDIKHWPALRATASSDYIFICKQCTMSLGVSHLDFISKPLTRNKSYIHDFSESHRQFNSVCDLAFPKLDFLHCASVSWPTGFLNSPTASWPKPAQPGPRSKTHRRHVMFSQLCRSTNILQHRVKGKNPTPF